MLTFTVSVHTVCPIVRLEGELGEYKYGSIYS